MRRLLPILLILLGIGMLPSCIEDDFDTSSSVRLAFSTDTLSFDTVFTDQGTPTARLKVYNRASKAVNISTIEMKEASGIFQMNVDGLSGRSFRDIEIRGGDSIFVFVECKLPENSVNTPVLTSDAIVFTTNGTRQEVVLEAWGQNVKRLRSLRVTEDMRLSPDIPYVVFDSLIVEKGATLRVDPGVQLLFHDKASLTVRGTLEAVGSPGKMIDMRGDRLDNVLPSVSYDIMAGQWQGVRLEKESFGNRMEYVDMRSTVHGLEIDSTADLSRRKLLLLNSWLHNSRGNALTSRYAWVDALGCVFSEGADHVVSLTGGRHLFAQCTLANNHLFAGRWLSILGLYHLLPDKPESGDQPLMEADFDNSIIYGLTAPHNQGDLKDSSVYMRYVLFGVEGDDDDHFIKCLWDKDPLFLTVRPEYYFNYRVASGSPAIGAGDPSLVPAGARTDIDGIDRLLWGAPTLGAYQYVPSEGDD